MIRRFCLSALLSLALGGLAPQAALAYYPFDGPGPDEIMIGIDNSGGYDVPLCEYVGPPDGAPEGQDYGDPGGYWVDQYSSLAWGQDANGQATYSWYMNATSQAEADSGAITQCTASGFRDCRLATWVVNGAIGVAVDSAGTLYSDHGPDGGAAKKKALRACKKQGGKGCKIDRIIDSPAAWVSN